MFRMLNKIKNWRVAATAAVFALLLTGGALTAAEDAGGDGVEAADGARISLSYRRVPLERVLEYISRSSRGVNIKISVDDAEEEENLRRMLVTVELSNVSWRTAVDYIANKYRFVVNADNESEGVLLLERPPRITMNVQGAKLTAVIKLIAKQSGANIIVGPAVDTIENVSFDLRDVPWKKALGSILKTYGLVKVEEESGIIRIVSPQAVEAQREVRAIALKYIQPEGAHFQPELVSERASSFVSRRAGTTESSLEQSLLGVLGQLKSADGSVTYEPRSNMLIIKDTPTRIEEMVELIRVLDRAPRQVKVESRILTHRIGPETMNYGVNWANGLIAEQTSGVKYQNAFPFSSESTMSLGILEPAFKHPEGPYLLDEALKLNWASNPVAATPTDSYTLGTLSFEQLKATLKLAATSNKVDIVQAPEIVTMDNQEATVFIGSVTRYALLTVETTDAGASEGLEQKELMVGVQLMVVPHICGDTDQVILEIVPKEEEEPNFVSRNAGKYTLDLPESNIKIAHTRMMLNSGETGVIAGLIKRSSTEGESKVPFLGDIPVLGYMFKSRNTSKSVNNTIIMVTPWILRSNHGEGFNKELEDMRDLAAAGM
jgi:type IV pilus assembly protein PilQ